ncbi:MAG: LysM peptidoglycan-binding domain-containing protein [Cyclobacteriaceae bacterium]
MQKTLLACFLFVVSLAAGAQELTASDSVLVQMDSVKTSDSIRFQFSSIEPSELEFIPSEATPELLEDRLNCIEQTIHLRYNDKVHAFINYFTIRDREYTRSMLRKQQLYFPLFEKYLAQYKMPDELKYLSIIESGLNPRAISRARAVGLWQFMAYTGKYFGLYNNWYIDDRMDPEKATEAACQYLSQLHGIFNDWELALAAYNSGPGTVLRAVRRSGYKKDFWQIYPYLPSETRSYVPQYIAIIYAMKYHEEHNIFIDGREELPPSDTLTLSRFTNFETLAALTGTCVEDLQILNPSVQRNAVPQSATPFVMRLPVHAKQALNMNRMAILDSASKVGKRELEEMARNSPGSTWGREQFSYRVRSGDGLGIIAQRFHVRIDDIRKWNNISGSMIHPGQNLTLWVTPAEARRNRDGETVNKTSAIPVSSDGKVYVVQPGDTLWDISRKFQGLTIEKIKALNNLRNNKLQPGQKLIIG